MTNARSGLPRMRRIQRRLSDRPVHGDRDRAGRAAQAPGVHGPGASKRRKAVSVANATAPTNASTGSTPDPPRERPALWLGLDLREPPPARLGQVGEGDRRLGRERVEHGALGVQLRAPAEDRVGGRRVLAREAAGRDRRELRGDVARSSASSDRFTSPIRSVSRVSIPSTRPPRTSTLILFSERRSAAAPPGACSGSAPPISSRASSWACSSVSRSISATWMPRSEGASARAFRIAAFAFLGFSSPRSASPRNRW